MITATRTIATLFTIAALCGFASMSLMWTGGDAAFVFALLAFLVATCAAVMAVTLMAARDHR